MNPSTTTIHPTAIIDPGASIGEGTEDLALLACHARQHYWQNCSLGQNVVMMSGASLGDNVKVQNNVSIYTGVHCEDDVFLGPSMVFTNVINPRSTIVRKHEYKTTYVRKGATIGANATIVCGIEIGEYAFIGAGAVVTKHVPAYALVMGNPARQTGWMSRNGYKLKFDENGIGVCPESGERYFLEDKVLQVVI
ncbi:MAG: N-acetyltransferase [Saprospiraceae bacterium]|nr:N-acetyltransferase [Saprospiraceae bacterium]